MADLVKSVLGGAWSLIVGWILPVFLTLQLVNALFFADVADLRVFEPFTSQSPASRQVALLAIAAVAGLVLAALQAPLYRVLEGYLLWPRNLAHRRIEMHRRRRAELVAKQAAIAGTDRGVESGLRYERAARYPAADKQFAPTTLGNAIRRFETYAGDRYRLDSQLLWHNLVTAAPERAAVAVNNARTNVDFFVCLVYGGVVTALCGIAVTVLDAPSPHAVAGIVLGAIISFASYRFAVLGTDEWDAAVRAVVDHGRAGTAASFGLTVPHDFEEERLMWRAVNTLVRRPYSYSQTHQVPELIQRFRQPRDVATEDKQVSFHIPAGLGELLEEARRTGTSIVVVAPGATAGDGPGG